MIKRAACKSKHVQIKRGKIYLTKEELEKIKRINYYNFKIRIQTHKIKFKKPKKSFENYILRNKTYSLKLYVPIQVKYNGTEIINRV